jgi:hypothetical protein
MAQPSITPRPNPNEKLVRVFDTEQDSEAIIVKGLLDSANIESDLTAASFMQETFPGLGGVIILVRQEDAEKARTLIAEYRRNQLTADDETQEIDVSDNMEEPPAKA